MVSKLHSHVGEKAVRAVMDQPSTTKPNKKKGGSLSLVPEKRKLVKTMAFLSIVEFFGSFFCASGCTHTNSADSTSKIPSARNSKQTVPEPHGLTSQEA